MKKASVVMTIIFAVVAMFSMVEAACVSYEVEKGDMLSGIAFKMLGNANLYARIAEKNGIENPNLIFPGQVFEVCKEETSEVVGAVESKDRNEIVADSTVAATDAKIALAVQHVVLTEEAETPVPVSDMKAEESTRKALENSSSFSFVMIGIVLMVSVAFAVAYVMYPVLIHNKRINMQVNRQVIPDFLLKSSSGVEVEVGSDEHEKAPRRRKFLLHVGNIEVKTILVVLLLGVCAGLACVVFL